MDLDMTIRPGDTALERLAKSYMDLDLTPESMRLDTERYYSPEYMALEEEALWSRTWQMACRADDVPEPGAYFEYVVGRQSYLIVRDEAGEVRAFHNACRHRGNLLCRGAGKARTLTCPYHLWQYGLDGRLVHVSDPETFVGLDQAQYGLKRVSAGVRCGFVFINPDPQAAPLDDFLAPFADFMDRFNIAEMVPVGLNAGQRIACNWKVVVDAFEESYHVQGVHPQNLPMSNDIDRKFVFADPHRMFVAPFGTASPRLGDVPVEEVVEAFGLMEEVFKGPGAPNPMEKLVAPYRGEDGEIRLPEGVDLRILAQRAQRARSSPDGPDYSRLTDAQLTDVTHVSIFPNLTLTLRGDETNLFWMLPDPEGDPEACILHVANYRIIPDPEERARLRTPPRRVDADFSFGLAVDQDREMMPRQQIGLRSRGLDHVVLSRQEIGVAHFHAMVDRTIADWQRRRKSA
jgi:phenylpropionate dioxygenase-like ring-hydroxylating dioxygenase large terminal subunit